MALAETWWQIGPALAQRGWRVTAIDLPGHAGDVHRDGALDLDALVDGVGRASTAPVDLLVGHSLGAIVALGLLARDPGVARAVVLEEPPGTCRHRPGRARRLHRARRRGGASRPRPAGGPRARGQPALGPGDVERSCAASRRPTATRSSPPSNGRLRWDLTALLAAVEIPTLVLAAHDAPGSFPLDPGSALRGADRAAVRAAVAPEHFEVLDGGHCLHRDDPARWLAAVDGFASAALG